ncbi:hypothetical protein V1477_013618 [Vespula maculifrons]|uniref:Uncharacterized protein n=1 Tax=Vespula maculifrons TaxID=7453 RepID=A0ABD2BQ46_VESMC
MSTCISYEQISWTRIGFKFVDHIITKDVRLKEEKRKEKETTARLGFGRWGRAVLLRRCVNVSIAKVRAGGSVVLVVVIVVVIVVIIIIVIVVVVVISGHWEEGLSIAMQARDPIAPQPVLPLLARSASNCCSSLLMIIKCIPHNCFIIKNVIVCIPKESCYVIGPVVWEHHEKEADSNEDHSGQLHAHEVRSIKNDIQSYMQSFQRGDY